MISTGLISFLFSTVISSVLKIWAIKTNNYLKLRQAELKAMNARASITENAREYDNPGFQWTRRFIVVVAVLSIIALPLWAPLYYSIAYPVEIATLGKSPLAISFCYDVVTQGFWPFWGSETITECNDFTGIAIQPLHVELMSSIMGLYFGNRIGNGRM